MRDQRLCRSIGPHPFDVVPPLILVPGGKRAVLHCPRCLTWRLEIWGARGDISKRRYEHSPEYKAYIQDHSRAEARVDIMDGYKTVASAMEHPHLRQALAQKGTADNGKADSNNPRVRLAQAGKRAARVRHRKLPPVKREGTQE